MDVRIKTDIVSEPVSLEEVRQFLKFDETDANEDALILNMIYAARSYIEKHAGIAMGKKVFQVLFNYDEDLILPITPVISVDKVETIDIEGTATELALNTDYYVRGLQKKEIVYSLGSAYQLRVEFSAGYGDDATETLPADLRHALLTQVMQWYENRDDFHELNIMGSVQRIIEMYNVL